VLESEAIFQLDIDEDDGNFANRSLIDIYTANNGNAAHGISLDLLNKYEPSDARNGWYIDEEDTPALDRHVFKYAGGLGIDADAHAFPVMRLTEFVLMVAECEARAGNEMKARELVPGIKQGSLLFVDDEGVSRRAPDVVYLPTRFERSRWCDESLFDAQESVNCHILDTCLVINRF
jgi:hypothetical protein